ncbi:carboxymethylenebutenolidase [Catenulispora sp. EB89]|uniref:dienelactone hydrolase family protein n=1 Tax=Catenulispora sp. EB89 TaxID=3156257 RepID=UPI0035172D80
MCIETHRDFPAEELLTLTAGDGTTFGAFHARAENPSSGRIILLPDMGGLRGDYVSLARHFTGTGCDVVAIDYYGRTAGVGPHAEDFDYKPHMAEARRENVLADIAAAIAYLDTFGSGPTYTLGFCVGGAHALYSGTAAPEVLGAELAGVVAFCPWTGAYGHAEALPDDFISALRVPVLGLFGGSDKEVPVAVPESFEAQLTAAGRPHEIAVYPHQPHGFYEYHHLGETGHTEAAEDAWQRLESFTKA